MIDITPTISLNESEISFSFIRASGPGGQNVNKVATAVLLRFNVLKSPTLSDEVRMRLIFLAGKNINLQGELIIKAGRFRTQERNRQDALDRLTMLVLRAATVPKKRKKTRAAPAVRERRLQSKKLHAKTKSLRRHKPDLES